MFTAKSEKSNQMDMAQRWSAPIQLESRHEPQDGFFHGDISMHYNSGKPIDFSSTDVIQLFPDYNARRAEIDANQHLSALERLEIDHIRPRLSGDINYRYGGSFAAFLQGARRIPNDIDVEVESNEDVQNAAGRMNDLTVDMAPDGRAAFCEGDISFDFQGTQVSEPVAVDIVNENNPVFGEHVKTPEESGEAFTTGDISTNERLFMNYLDRTTFTPGRSKNDDQQIMDILNAHGAVTDDIDNINQIYGVIDFFARDPDHASAMKGKLRDIVESLS